MRNKWQEPKIRTGTRALAGMAGALLTEPAAHRK